MRPSGADLMHFAASVTFLFRERPLLERFSAAREAGFAGVEIQRLGEGDPAEMARAARDAAMPVALVNVPSGDWLDGGCGLSGVPGREKEFGAALERTLDAAVLLGARYVHLGPSRVPDGCDAAECIRVLAANARLALALSRAAGVGLLVEAMNRVEPAPSLLDGIERAAAVVCEVAHPRFGLQLDVYHAALNEDDPVAAFVCHRAIVRHVQFADVPGRHEPGTGRLDLPGILRGIVAEGYTGWFGAEYVPAGDTAAGLTWLRAFAAREAGRVA